MILDAATHFCVHIKFGCFSMPETLTVADAINTALLFVTALGVFAAFWQIRAGARSQRATFLKDLYMQLRTDSEVAKAFYLIEYGQFEYDDGFHGSELERGVDRLLTLIDLVCEMRSQGVISKREMNFFDYQFKRVAGDQNVQSYLTFLNEFYERNGMDRKPFSAFQTYAKKFKLCSLKSILASFRRKVFSRN